MRATITSNIIDIKKLDEAMKIFECEHCSDILGKFYNDDYYLIMSEETCAALTERANTIFSLTKASEHGKVCRYRGHHIAIDDSLSFGEVVIR